MVLSFFWEFDRKNTVDEFPRCTWFVGGTDVELREKDHGDRDGGTRG
jgi:hypothetical protein